MAVSIIHSLVARNISLAVESCSLLRRVEHYWFRLFLGCVREQVPAGVCRVNRAPQAESSSENAGSRHEITIRQENAMYFNR